MNRIGIKPQVVNVARPDGHCTRATSSGESAEVSDGDGCVLAIAVTLGNHRYELERAQFGARPVAKVCHQSGGVVLSTRTVSPDEWSRGLAEALVRTLGADAAAVEALQRLTAP